MRVQIQYQNLVSLVAMLIPSFFLIGCGGGDTTGSSSVVVVTGSSGSGGMGGSGGSAGGPIGDIVLGEPISAPDGQWTDIQFPEGYCRDGTKAHISVHRNSASKKFAIYLEGGGACFNDASCNLLTFNFELKSFNQGIFNFDNADNPLRDWNIFYVPYCTGDVHAGNNPAGDPGPLTPDQHFAGYTNLQLYLSRILATMPDATDELLTGISAGGFGTALNTDLVARNMPATVERFTVLDDSGPPMSTKYMQACLQDSWQNVWGFQNSILKDCGSSCPNTNDFGLDYLRFISDKWANGPYGDRFMAGIISATGDGIISTFFGFGALDCKTPTPIPLSAKDYEAGLLEMRDVAKSKTDRFGTFFYPSTAHTTLALDASSDVAGVGLLGGLYNVKAGNVLLTDWIKDLLAHKPATHAGP